MDNERLIELVRDRAFLYDVSHSKYSDIKRKEKAWQEIAIKLNQPASDCKRAWVNLREALRRTLKKRRESKSEQNPKKIRKWKFENEMSFLLPYYRKRSTSDDLPAADSEISYDDDNDNSNSTEETFENSTFGNSTMDEQLVDLKESIPSELEKVCSRYTGQTIKSNETPPSTSALMEYLIKSRERASPPHDDLDKFFLSMSSTVKKFTPYNIAVAKSQIFAIVSSLEIKELEQQKFGNTQMNVVGGSSSDADHKPSPSYHND